ncbi:hypothetical protein L9Z41_19365 [Leptospira noguchii]|uniref:hypothetical protein n=1 Tax=Leptospira noguchii TaxID=28182 RepID=UPI001F05902A|nr:hypothetical protein [Leptospira noguchii]MCH1913966.1 hypothetical protein [Leptospira noguchii]MCH1917727.1 hypothetical protein [Leptospira noguchii]
MIKAVKKENNKVALLLSQEEQSITKSAGCLDREIKLLKMLQLSVKLAQLDFTWKKFHKSNRLFSIKKLYSSQIEFI